MNVNRIRHHLLPEMIASHFYRCIGVFCPYISIGSPDSSELPLFYSLRVDLSILFFFGKPAAVPFRHPCRLNGNNRKFPALPPLTFSQKGI